MKMLHRVATRETPMTITDPSPARRATTKPDHHVVIIGAGFGGIGAAVELERAGIDDYVILAKWDGPGGPWRAHRNPGVAVALPSRVSTCRLSQLPRRLPDIPPH